MLVNEATAFNFGMLMAHRCFDENGVRHVSDTTAAEEENMLDNIWYERRDDSTLDEKTHVLQFHKEPVAYFRKTEEIRRNRLDKTIFLRLHQQ